jgi:predicted phage terminase large subunit-like protein
LEKGEIRRLAVFMPPGSAKSTYTSVLFPPFYLAKKPNRALLACSHSTDLAEAFGRRARNLIEAQATVLGYGLAEHSKAAGRWETTKGGQYLAAGVGVGIAGYRADLGLIDDPIRNKEDADSKLVRDKQWDWYQFDFKPRLKPNAVIGLIQTRWHEDDLGGRILSNEKGDWEVIRIPFLAEDNDPLGRPKGQMLWPEWFKLEMFPTDSRVANALYQNNPTPEEGDFFKKEWLVEYRPEQLPKFLRMYCASDHAVSLREEADPTLLIPFGVDEGENIWILPDIFWGRADTAAVVEHMFRLVKAYKPIAWFAGKEHITSSIGPFINKKMIETGQYFYIRESVAKKDKPTRCQAIRGRMAQRKVFFPSFYPRWHEAKHEILAFPAGTHDEWPDVLGEIGRGLAELTCATVPETEKDPLADLQKSEKMTLGWLKKEAERQSRGEMQRYGGR